MPRYRSAVALAAATLSAALLLVGCQNGSPIDAPDAQALATVNPDLPQTVTDNLVAGTQALGLYDFTIDPVAGTVELTPMRAATALADTYILDLTGAFTTGTFGCPGCLSADAISRVTIGPDSFLDVTFTASHPFPTPVATGRKDLHINNVRLALIADDGQSFYGDTPTDFAVGGNVDRMANADGYVVLPPGFISVPSVTNLLFPFRVFQTGDNLADPFGNFDAINGWADNGTDPTGYNVLSMGGSATTSLRLKVANGESVPISGRLALLGNYIVSARNRTERPTPTYFMPEGAMPQAWHVEVGTGSPFSEAAGTEIGTVTVRVADWQAGKVIDPAFPESANPEGLLADGEVAAVKVDIPDWNLPPFGPETTPASGTGTFSDPYVFPVSITKFAGTPEGTYAALAKVIDRRTDYNALKADLATSVLLSEMATYQVGWITVTGVPNVPPSCGGYTTTPGSLTNIAPNTQVDLTFDFLNDSDGTITNVEVDWDFDGVTFLPDANRTTAGVLSQTIAANCTIAIRFTDNDGAQNDPALCTLPVTILTSFFGPIIPGPAYGGSNVSRIDHVINRPPLATFGDNIYLLVRDGLIGSGTGFPYVLRSPDGGTTWGTPQLVVSTQIFSNGIATTAGGEILIATVQPGAATPRLHRYINSGVSGLVNDGVSNLATTGFQTIAHLNMSLTTDPTDGNLAYLAATEDNVSVQGIVRFVRIQNAEGSPTFNYASTGNGEVFNIGACCLIQQAMIVADANGDVHAIARWAGSPFGIRYREYLKSTSTWRAAVETVPTGAYNCNDIGLAVGHNDNLPVICYGGNGLAGQDDAYVIKATNSVAPTFLSSTAMIVSEVTTGAQQRPMPEVNNLNGDIYIVYGDDRDPVESSSSRRAGFLSRFNSSLTRTFPDLKIDGAGTGDNSSGTGDFVHVITNRGTPTSRKLVVFWRDSDEVLPNPDLKHRIATLL